MLIWHVDESMPDNNDRTHFLVDLEEASAAQDLELSDNNTGDDSDYFRSNTKTTFGDTTTPNSKSYSGGGLKLIVKNISVSGSSMSFYLDSTDVTPPAAVAVNDGLAADISKTGSSTQLSANWGASSDPETGIKKYWYAIGTSAGLANVVDWTANALVLSVTKSGLSLTGGSTYYFGVKAENGVGVYANPAWSNGQWVDNNLPGDVPYVYDGTGADVDYAASLDRLSANWGESAHPSGINRYEFAIGTSPGDTNTKNWTSNGVALSTTVAGLNLTDNTTYYFSVRAYSNSGFYSPVRPSDGQRTDVSGPTAKIEVSSTLPAKSGHLNLKLIIAEAGALNGPPVLTFTPSGGAPHAVSLSYLASSTWTGSAFIESFYSTGTAAFSFGAVDMVGNSGSLITAGGTFLIDMAVVAGTSSTVVNSDSSTVIVPAGAWAQDLFIRISTIPSTRTSLADSSTFDSHPLQGVDLNREFTAKTSAGWPVTSFNTPLTIRLCYQDADNDGRIDIDNVSESLAGLYLLDESSSKWTPAAGVLRDAAANCVSAQTSHFSVYAVRTAEASQPGMGSLAAFPNPCYFDRAPFALTIRGIPADVEDPKIYIYNTAGELVRVLEKGAGIDSSNNGVWDGRNKGGAKAASGFYMYLLKTGNYGKATGKFYVFW
jgi:hypothetical protein